MMIFPKTKPDWSRLHKEKTLGLWSLSMAFLSVLYGAGVGLRLWTYNRGLFRRRSLPGFGVSVGNITTGGTGKTPAVAMVAVWARKEGHRVAILSRGYGGTYKNEVLEVSDGRDIKADQDETGDEPYLLAKNLPGIPVVLSKKRYLAGLYAHEKFGTDFFILDDGFQHLNLKPDLNIALIDGVNPFGNGRLLPWGPLREPVNQLGRADVFILTRVSDREIGEKNGKFLKDRFPSIPVFFADHKAKRVVLPYSKKTPGLCTLEGKRVLGFAGIARPELFRDTLMGLGADVIHFKGFRDHYRFQREEIVSIIQTGKDLKADYILTTEKDWVRIEDISPVCGQMGYLCIEFTFVSGKADFFGMIRNGVKRKQAS
jgi:tetraacyldisaccharide 4'-kinase